jgi:hypothetical protein
VQDVEREARKLLEAIEAQYQSPLQKFFNVLPFKLPFLGDSR